MAEPESGAIVKLEAQVIPVYDFDERAQKVTYQLTIPSTSDFDAWDLTTQALMLKRGMWSKLPLPEIIWGLCYARRIGADVVEGDLFPTGNGRFGQSNGYRIRKAKESGNWAGPPEFEWKDTGKALPERCKKCSQKTDLECTVKVYVKGWTKPIIKTHLLSEWYKDTEPWNNTPRNQLEQNTLGHACRYVPGVPMDSNEEAPPPEAPASITTAQKLREPDLTPALEASIEKVKEAKHA